MRDDKFTCKDCQAFDSNPREKLSESKGYCRKYAASPVHPSSYWPYVLGTDWCMELVPTASATEAYFRGLVYTDIGATQKVEVTKEVK